MIMDRPDKKIGILTFHCVQNYGAMLQAYALKGYLCQEGYDARIINYRSSAILAPYEVSMSLAQAAGRRVIVFPWRWPESLKTLHWVKTHPQEQIGRREKFRRFEEEYLLDSGASPVPYEEIGRLPVDAFIFGSDQIWNTDITGEEEDVYWGLFPTEGQKRIVYGASLSHRELRPAEQRNIQRCLSSFDAVSVREKALAEKVEELTGQRVPVVVDPTLLLSREDYERSLPLSPPGVEPYVLLYMMRDSEEAMKAAKRTGLPVKIVGCRIGEHFIDVGPGKILNAGPIEFLNLAYHAKYIITNSFHGTVFSILFQRPFCVISGEDDRIDNLLRLAGLEKARIPDAGAFSPGCFVQSTEDTFQRLRQMIDLSKGYLKNALSGG